MHHRKPKFLLLFFVAGFLLTACGESSDNFANTYDNTAEVDAYYAAHPERFVFAGPADLPADLVWEDGAGLPTFADPRARRGGQLQLRLQSMQQTLSVLGPDANGTLRGPLWSANTVGLIERHPWEDGYIPGVARQIHALFTSGWTRMRAGATVARSPSTTCSFHSISCFHRTSMTRLSTGSMTRTSLESHALMA